MEYALVGVSLLSFAIASGMSLIAWKLLRAQDRRTQARADRLAEAAADASWSLDAEAPADASWSLDAEAPADDAGRPAHDLPMTTDRAIDDPLDRLAAPTPMTRATAELEQRSASHRTGSRWTRVATARRARDRDAVPAEVPPELAQFPDSDTDYLDAPPPAPRGDEDPEIAEEVRQSGAPVRHARRPASRPPTRRPPADVPFDERPIRRADDLADTPLSDAAPLFGPAAPTAPSSGPRVALVVVALVLASGAGTAFALRDTPALSLLPFGREATGAGTERPPLELTSLGHVVTPGGDFTVSGVVQNPDAGPPAAHVAAVVYLFGADGRQIATGRAPLLVDDLRGGQTSSFAVTVPGVTGVTRYRVGFRLRDGEVVAHVDRRDDAAGGSGSAGGGGVDSDSRDANPDHVVTYPRGTRPRTEG
ncbi:MAG: hypothetical protein R2752_03445 [Vicinamibacterales bacterium]